MSTPAADCWRTPTPDLVLFHCTAVTTIAPELEERLRTSMERRTGVPAVTTGAALVAALRALVESSNNIFCFIVLPFHSI